MPLIPSSSTNLNTTPVADTPLPFDVTLGVVDVPQDFVTIPGGKKGMKISVFNYGPGSAWIHANGTATLAPPSIELKVNDTYYDDGLGILNRWSFVGDIGLLPHIRGMAWAGVA